MKKWMRNLRHYLVLSIVIALINIFFITPVLSETLRMLIWGEYATEEHQQKFITMVKEKYNIDLKFKITFADSLDCFFSALRGQQADIVSPTHQLPKDKRFQLIKLNLVIPLNMKNIPNYQHIIPVFQRLDFCSEKGDIYGVPVANVPYGLAYNTGLLSKAPESWNIFLDPKYKGKYSISNTHYEPNVYITALMMGIDRKKLGDYKTLNTPDFQEKLRQLAVNTHHFWGGIETAEDLKGLVFATAWGSSLPQLRKMGEFWKMAEPKEGVTSGIDHFMLSHTLKNQPMLKRIAEEWLDYLLSDESQLYMARERGLSPTVVTVKKALTPEEILEFHLDDPTYYERQRILWPVLEKLDRKGLRRLWDKAMKQRN
ncbi:MAG: extracellular solute-binding protein [Candidatus Magnetomorum sp.]|nr:extracellular solute-binding protein [Candidatus Magnetomorum sp.]